MIDHYEFIDGKPGPGPLEGLKERKLGATTYLYNKLSAEETNNIKFKLDEIIDAINISKVPLFSVYGLKFKGDGNVNMQQIEVGDIAHRYSADGIEENARFNGGDPQDPASYTEISSKPDPELFTAPIDGPNQIFTLPAGFVAGSVLVSRGEIFKTLEWEQAGDELEILIEIYTGNSVYVKPQ